MRSPPNASWRSEQERPTPSRPDEARQASSVDLSAGGADHVFEAIGLVETVELAVDLTRPGGNDAGRHDPDGDRAAIDVYRFVEDGKRLLGSNYGSAVPARDFPRIAGRRRGRAAAAGPARHRAHRPDGIVAAFEAMRRRDGARRVMMFD